MDELTFKPATELATLVRSKAVSPVEIVDAVLARLDAVQPKINAFVFSMADSARAQAKVAERAVTDGAELGPLHGVPVSIKDFIDIKGLPTAFGSRVQPVHIAGEDAVVTARARAAGAIIIGKTTGPDGGWKATGDSPLTGSTRNPWSLQHTSGGSSSGSAAAVAAGVGPLSIGTDGAGSIRVPASFCGIFGMKPSYGRVPQPGQSPALTSHTGPLSRTVADGALLLKVIAGPVNSDPVTLGDAPADYPSLLEAGIAGKRIAYSRDLGFVKRIDREVEACCDAAVRAFEAAGATVDLETPDWGDAMPLIMDMWPAVWAGRIGDKIAAHRDVLDPALVTCAEEGLAQAPTTFFRAQMRRVTYCEHVQAFFDRFDFLVTPSVAVPALEVGRIRPADYPEHPWNWLEWAAFSFPFNLTWNPAATVPAGFTADGRPIGLQIVGRRFDDLGVLRAAAAFEKAKPWSHLWPTL